MLHTLYRDPFVLGHPQINRIGEGCTVLEIVERTPNLPEDFLRTGVVTVNGDLLYREHWDRVRPKNGTVVAMHAHIGGGDGGGKQVFALIAAIALSVVTGGIAAGALAPYLGASFAAGTIGASVLAGAVGIAGALAISALTAPPTAKPGADQSSGGLRLEAASVDGNILEANTPVPRVIGTRKCFPPFLTEPIIELVGQDEFVEAVWGLAGPHDLSDIRLGDATIDLSDEETLKDVSVEVRNGVLGETPLTLTPRQGRTFEPNLTMSVHTVDPENQDTIEGVGDAALPVFHAITTRISPNENWIHFLIAGLASQEEPGSLRIPFRIRMRRRGDTAWRDLPEFHYQNETQSQVRLQVKIYWGEAWTDALPEPPATIGFVEARKVVPAQDVQPLGTVFNADSYFSAGAGNDVYRSGTAVTTNIRNMLLFPESVEIYLDSTWEPGIWDIEIKRGATFENANFVSASYEYSSDVLDFFGRRDTGVLPLTRENLLDQITLVRLVNIWNEHPIAQPGLTLIALKARNRAVNKLSAIASGLVYDLPPGRGPIIQKLTSDGRALVTRDDIPDVADVEVLALVRPLVLDSGSQDISGALFIRASGDITSETGYRMMLRRSLFGNPAGIQIAKFVNGAFTELATSAFSVEDGKSYFMRFRAIGTSIQSKVWLETESEPVGWAIEVTDSSITSQGWVGLFVFPVDPQTQLNWFSVGLNGDDAPSPPDLVPLVGAEDGNDSFTKVLLHFDGLPGATGFVDEPYGGSYHAWTAAGTAQIDTSEKKFGGGSGLFDGTGDYISTPDHADFALGSGDWTIDFWFNCVHPDTDFGRMAGQHDDTNAGSAWRIVRLITTTTISVQCYVGSTAFTVTSTSEFDDATNTGWHHLAVVRTGDVLKMFIDGVQEGGDVAITGAINDSSATLKVGTYGGNFSPYTGWIDEFRLSVGIARWTSNFTPPSLAYTVPLNLQEGNDSFTKALLSFDRRISGSNVFFDTNAGGTTKYWTPAGNAQCQGNQLRFGHTAATFDGAGDTISTPAHADYELGDQDFTIESWFRCTATTGVFRRLAGQNDNVGAAVSRAWAIARTTTNVLRCGVAQDAVEYEIFGTTQFTDAINPGWHHVAFVRTGDTLKMFVDGVQEGGDLAFSGSVNASQFNLVVGSTGEEANLYWEGQIDQFRLSIGVARWTSNFAPPSVPYAVGALADDFSDQVLGRELIGWTQRYQTMSSLVTENNAFTYNGGATDWSSFRASSNPAPHFRDILTGLLNFDPLPSALLDEASLLSWRQRCDQFGFTCDMVVEGLEVPDLLRVVSSCGFARLYRSELFGVIQDYDRSSESPVQLFSPRNSAGLSWRKAYTRLPAGFRINFREEDLDYGSDQVVVLNPGVEGSASRLEQVTYDGLVRQSDVIRRATFDLLQASRRATFYTFNAPAESIVCRRGDLIGLNHDLLQRQYGYARVREVIYDNEMITGVVLDAPVEVFNEADVLGTYDMLEVDNVFDLGIISAVAIRQTDGTTTIHRLATTTNSGETDELEFLTPVPIKYGYSSIYDRKLIHTISKECLVVVGIVGSEYRRLIISEIAPQTNLEAQLVCVDEASDMFATVFGG